MYAFSRDAYYRALECEPADIYAKRAIVRDTLKRRHRNSLKLGIRL